MRPLEALLGSLRHCLDRFPDKCRSINTTYGMGDIGMLAAIAVYRIFPSWDDLLLTLAFAKPPPNPP